MFFTFFFLFLLALYAFFFSFLGTCLTQPSESRSGGMIPARPRILFSSEGERLGSDNISNVILIPIGLLWVGVTS